MERGIRIKVGDKNVTIINQNTHEKPRPPAAGWENDRGDVSHVTYSAGGSRPSLCQSAAASSSKARGGIFHIEALSRWKST